MTSPAPALHEIATNAAKYGALSSADGDVRIVQDARRSAAPRLGGERRPQIDAPPQAAGFGSAFDAPKHHWPKLGGASVTTGEGPA